MLIDTVWPPVKLFEPDADKRIVSARSAACKARA